MSPKRLLWLTATLWAGVAGAQLVAPPLLVVSAQSPLTHLSLEEARKLYLGVPVAIDGLVLKPLHNHSDPLCKELFLQKIMFMSAEAYERQVLHRNVHADGDQGAVYTNSTDLLNALLADRTTISYMQRNQAAALPGLKIIGEP